LAGHRWVVSAGEPTVTASYLTEDPDRDYVRIGAGFVFVLPDGFSPFMNYRAELFNENETTQTVSRAVAQTTGMETKCRILHKSLALLA
jgi:hypothetical protein